MENRLNYFGGNLNAGKEDYEKSELEREETKKKWEQEFAVREANVNLWEGFTSIDDLEKVGELKQKGLITEEEFNKVKKKILDNLK